MILTLQGLKQVEDLEGSYDPLLHVNTNKKLDHFRCQDRKVKIHDFGGQGNSWLVFLQTKKITQTSFQLIKNVYTKYIMLKPRYNVCSALREVHEQKISNFLKFAHCSHIFEKKLVLSLTTVVFFSICCYFFVSIQKKNKSRKIL